MRGKKAKEQRKIVIPPATGDNGYDAVATACANPKAPWAIPSGQAGEVKLPDTVSEADRERWARFIERRERIAAQIQGAESELRALRLEARVADQERASFNREIAARYQMREQIDTFNVFTGVITRKRESNGPASAAAPKGSGD